MLPLFSRLRRCCSVQKLIKNSNMYFTYSNILVWRRKYSKVTIFNPQKFSLIEMSKKILSRVIYRCKFSLETKISSEKASQSNCVTGIKMSRHLLVCLTTQNKPFCSIEIWDRNEQNNYLKNSPGQYNVSIKKGNWQTMHPHYF